MRDKFTFITYEKRLLAFSRINRINPTLAEARMWDILKKDCFKEYRFLRQKPLYKFIADFYCSAHLLVIEVDGDYHDDNKEYDKLREDILRESFAIEIIRFTNEEILKYPDLVIKKLLKKLQQINPS
ncbi:MAG: endonuclease domain-containing protein [Candidatus Margulisbacteria bacterium]|nr:endonuclease domain-containing protein [Candidatus Margulisiibacteriota bacterium]